MFWYTIFNDYYYRSLLRFNQISKSENTSKKLKLRPVDYRTTWVSPFERQLLCATEAARTHFDWISSEKLDWNTEAVMRCFSLQFSSFCRLFDYVNVRTHTCCLRPFEINGPKTGVDIDFRHFQILWIWFCAYQIEKKNTSALPYWQGKIQQK